jgi:hypothetical protein
VSDYCILIESSFRVKTITIGEITKETPKTFKIKECDLGSCYRSSINKEFDKFKVVDRKRAEIISLFYRSIRSQFQAVENENRKAYYNNLDIIMRDKNTNE